MEKLRRAVQIGIVVRDIHRSTELLSSIFGLGPFQFIEWPNRPDSKYWLRGSEKKIKIRQAFAQAGSLELELIQPLEGTSAYGEFLESHGEGIHHVLFETPDMDAALDEFAQHGVTVLQTGTGIRPGTKWALLDTQDLVGFLIELRHRPGPSDGASIPSGEV
ncbi:MAG: VOC family protein [Acidobacteriaceae bacterium]|nr:VOC family protein [Acidobacteriaceae bacterium]